MSPSYRCTSCLVGAVETTALPICATETAASPICIF